MASTQILCLVSEMMPITNEPFELGM